MSQLQACLEAIDGLVAKVEEAKKEGAKAAQVREKSPLCPRKEPCMPQKRALYAPEKSPVWKAKRDLLTLAVKEAY